MISFRNWHFSWSRYFSHHVIRFHKRCPHLTDWDIPITVQTCLTHMCPFCLLDALLKAFHHRKNTLSTEILYLFAPAACAIYPAVLLISLLTNYFSFPQHSPLFCLRDIPINILFLVRNRCLASSLHHICRFRDNYW